MQERKRATSNSEWKEVKENPHCSVPQLATDIRHASGKDVSAETVRSIMRNNGYNSPIARRELYINEVYK